MIDPLRVDDLMNAARAVGYKRIPQYQHSECFTTGAFDLILINRKDKGRNFELLESVCSRYEDVQDDEKFLEGFIFLLGELARSTDTSEMPRGMRKIISDNPSKTKELQQWYRTNG